MMKINKLKMLLAFMAVAILGACSSDSLVAEVETEADGYGAVELLCLTANDVAESQTRAFEAGKLPASLIPQIGEFSMTLEGTHYDKRDPKNYAPEGSYEKVSDGIWKVNYSSEWEKISGITGYDTNTGKLMINQLKTGYYDTDAQAYRNSYKVMINYGQTTGEGDAIKYVEGRNKPCFTGVSVDASNNNAETTFSIKPKMTTDVKVLAKMSNSCFVMNLTEWMLKYFTGIEVKIHTADNVFTFTQVLGEEGAMTFNYKQDKKVVTSTTDSNGQTTQTVSYEQVEKVDGLTLTTVEGNNFLTDATGEYLHIFINPGQQLSFSGSAKKSQTGTAVTFSEVTITKPTTVLAAQTRYKVTVDCDTAGAQGVTIGFNETWTEVEEEVNLNPDNK